MKNNKISEKELNGRQNRGWDDPRWLWLAWAAVISWIVTEWAILIKTVLS